MASDGSVKVAGRLAIARRSFFQQRSLNAKAAMAKSATKKKAATGGGKKKAAAGGKTSKTTGAGGASGASGAKKKREPKKVSKHAHNNDTLRGGCFPPMDCARGGVLDSRAYGFTSFSARQQGGMDLYVPFECLACGVIRHRL